MSKWLRDNGLSLVLFALFAVAIVGHGWSGWLAHNQELVDEGRAPLELLGYLRGGEFVSTVFENWESEFLQMSAYVVLTAYLFQRGSPESKDPDEKGPQDRDPKLDANKPDAPWPVRAGGVARILYAHSLGLALFLLFLTSFVLYWINSTRLAADEAIRNSREAPSLLEHLASADLWFESLQNWQSEFLSTAVLIVLAVVLRERGSPESKPVGAPPTAIPARLEVPVVPIMSTREGASHVIDCAIIGAGPAGLTAATYLSRFLRSVVVVDAGDSRLKRIPRSRNTPGFPEGISGTDLYARLRRQAAQFGATFVSGRVEEIHCDDSGFALQDGSTTLLARTVLLATGARLVEPEIAGLEEGLARGLIRYCPICDGFEARGKRIAVLAQRPAAIDEAVFLRTFSDDVSFLWLEAGAPTPKEIGHARSHGITLGPAPVVNVALRDDVAIKLGDETEQRFEVLYPCLGGAPVDALARTLGVEVASEGGVLVDAHQRTSVKGVYAAGDVLRGLDQIASACGQAAIAATAIHNDLNKIAPDA